MLSRRKQSKINGRMKTQASSRLECVKMYLGKILRMINLEDSKVLAFFSFPPFLKKKICILENITGDCV